MSTARTWTGTAAVFAIGACLAGTTPGAQTLAIGAEMPVREVAMKSVDGKMLTLAGVAGEKGTLVVFTCNHCPFVQAWQKRMVDIGNEAVQRGIGVVFVNANDPVKYPADNLDAMRKQAAKEGYRFPYVMDTTSGVARAFGAKRTPEVFLFDAEHKLVYHGAVDDNTYKPEEVKKPYLRDAVAALLAGEEIPVKTTKSVGCSIKFRK